MLVLLAGLARFIISPVEEIHYENRPAEKVKALNLISYYTQNFQDSVENTLSDQVHAATKMKKLYNIIDAGCALPVIEALQQHGKDYIAFRDVYFYEDMLVLRPVPLSDKAETLISTAARLNNYFSAAEDTDFYIYYIETDKDIDFNTNEKSGHFEKLCENLELKESHIAKLETNSYADYEKNFLATDHHWNGTGAYSAYLEICRMLGSTPIESLGVHTIDGLYLGTRAAGIEGVKPESFSVNIFDYPAMDITINGNAAEDYGMQSLFISNVLPSFSYGSVFGPDCQEIIFDTGNEGKNLLIMGDSYDNAIIKALGSGFSKTYCIDLRAYDAYSFDILEYITEKEIDSVLFIGGLDYFSSILY